MWRRDFARLILQQWEFLEHGFLTEGDELTWMQCVKRSNSLKSRSLCTDQMTQFIFGKQDPSTQYFKSPIQFLQGSLRDVFICFWTLAVITVMFIIAHGITRPQVVSQWSVTICLGYSGGDELLTDYCVVVTWWGRVRRAPRCLMRMCEELLAEGPDQENLTFHLRQSFPKALS